MVTMARDNVVSFPESARSAVSEQSRARTLREARDLVAQKLRETTRNCCAVLGEHMLQCGDDADEREQRNLYYLGAETLRTNAVRMEGLVAAHWLKLFDAVTMAPYRSAMLAPVAPAAELELLDLGDMDEQMAAKALADHLRETCEEGFFAAGRRLAYLIGQDEGTVAIEPILAETFQTAFKETALPTALRIEVLRGIQRMAKETLGGLVHDLNAFLVGRGVLPQLRRSYSRGQRAEKEARGALGADSGDLFNLLQRLIASPPGTAASVGGMSGSAGGFALGHTVSMATMAAAMEQAMATLDRLQHAPLGAAVAPTTSVLREFRQSDVGQGLGHVDAVRVDIVATLFDFIFDDPAIADPIKALVARLQIPVLKVAMLDKSFFSSKAHPARRLLDGFSRAAARCGPGAGHDDPLYARIAAIIDRVQSEFAHDARLFDVLCGELEEFLDRQEAEADARAEQAAPLVAEREKREMAAVAADAALATWLSGSLPSAVTDLLTHEWRALLVHHYVNDDHVGWEAALNNAADLVASVQPLSSAQARMQLATRLPVLVKSIHDGLDRIKVAMERRMALIDSLFSLHAAVLRGAAPVVTMALPQTPAEIQPEIVSESIEAGDTRLDSVSLVDADRVPVPESDSAAQQDVDDLRRGDWVEFVMGDAGAVRYRLSWISPERGILLFTNPQSPRAISVAPAALALQIERGEAAIVPVKPIFDRAVHRALEALKAA